MNCQDILSLKKKNGKLVSSATNFAWRFKLKCIDIIGKMKIALPVPPVVVVALWDCLLQTNVAGIRGVQVGGLQSHQLDVYWLPSRTLLLRGR